MATITVMDPVTRIEGHLKVELTIDNGRVSDARCTGNLFRGFESLLSGRDPRDAIQLTQRICGVCPISHSQAASLALEASAGKRPPTNARLIRNLVLGANYVQSHILHFYLLAALDFARGPQASPWKPQWEVDMRPGLDGVVAHLTGAIEARRRAHEMGAVFSGRMPGTATALAGGVGSELNTQLISSFGANLTWLLAFIRDTYIPDVLAVAEAYSDYYQLGAGSRNLLSYGVFEQDNAGAAKFLRAGTVMAGSSGSPQALEISRISEQVTHSWYDQSSNGANPAAGSTVPQYPKDGAYSWLKAPRYNGAPMECGALARMVINGDYGYAVSVMDRHAARASEALKIAQAMQVWLSQLREGYSVFGGFTTRPSTTGVGLTEAPRGALGHWLKVSSTGKIEGYQIITPTCWNASPRDGQEQPGPIEQALIGIPVQDPSQPIEALRVIHSFDPCLSCAVHVLKAGRKPELVFNGGRA